jgi:hypothetical protein
MLPDLFKVGAMTAGGPAAEHKLFSATHPDVDYTDTPADTEVLTYVAALGKWQARPAAGGVTDHALLSHLAYADAAHTGFCSLATAQTIAAQKLIDSAIGLRFGHAAGPLLQGPAAGDLLSITGDLKLTGYAAFAGGTPAATAYLSINPNTVAFGAASSLLSMTPVSCTVPIGGSLNALNASGSVSCDAGSTPSVRGLNFIGFVSGAGNPVEVTGVSSQVGCASLSGVISDLHAFYAPARYMTFAPGGGITRSHGLRIRDQGKAGVVTTFGLLIEPQTGSTNCYSIWAGANYAGTPRLRLDEGTPGAYQTVLHLAEGVTPTLRRVQWVDPGNGGANLVAGQRVMVLV